MAHFSYRQFQHDLYWGRRLYLMRNKCAVEGFPGKAKGQGFKAYLAEQKIPARRAYRLIDRYRHLTAIYVNVLVLNEDCLPTHEGLPSQAVWAIDLMECADAITRGKAAIKDKDSVTNDAAQNAEECRTELDAISDADAVTHAEATS